MVEIIPTNTCPQDLAELSARSELFSAFARSVQLDVCDGAFAPALSWPYHEGQDRELDERAAPAQGLPFADLLTYEVHLMVEDPRDIGARFARARVERIIGHIEAFADASDARAALDYWRESGAKEVGLALLLETPLSSLGALADTCDVVQFMSIAKLGYQGAAFEPAVYDRIRELAAAHPRVVIEVDGGVSEKNIAELARAGARRFGVGSALSKAADPKAAYERLKRLADDAAS